MLDMASIAIKREVIKTMAAKVRDLTATDQDRDDLIAALASVLLGEE